MNWRQWAFATVLCGGLDIAYAALLALLEDGSIGGMLRFVASGPFGDTALGWGAGGAALGLAVHFAIMAAMCAAGLWLLSREPLRGIAAWKIGTLYGLVLYCVMHGAVLPWRFGTEFPDPDRIAAGMALLPHVVLIGIPLALIARGRLFRRKRATS